MLAGLHTNIILYKVLQPYLLRNEADIIITELVETKEIW